MPDTVSAAPSRAHRTIHRTSTDEVIAEWRLTVARYHAVAEELWKTIEDMRWDRTRTETYRRALFGPDGPSLPSA